MESKTSFQESKSLNQYLLTGYPDLHITPSLDQSYYLGLIDTRSRDDDQVITKVLDLSDSQTMPSSDLFGDLLAGHPAHQNAATTGQSDSDYDLRGNETDTSRLLMVPQLWLWKLDERRHPWTPTTPRDCR